MFDVFKYYKSIFILKLSFIWWKEGGNTYQDAYEAIKEANDDFISSEEWKELKSKYLKKNPEEFKKALKEAYKEGIKTNVKVENEIEGIILNWNEWIEDTTNNTKNELIETKEDLYKQNLQILEEAFNKNRSLLLKKWVKWNIEEVKALQRILKSRWLYSDNIDWLFWKGTEKSVKELQTQLQIQWDYKSKIDWIFGIWTMKALVVSISKENSSWIVEKNIRTYTPEESENKIDAYSKSLDKVKELFSVSKDIQEAINRVRKNQNDWYHLWHGIKSLLWKNDREKVFAQWSEYEKLLLKNQNKLERALEKLGIDRYETNINGEEESDVLGNPKKSEKMRNASDFIIKTWPWLIWIYITDIPLPFTAKLIPGLDLNKSLALEKWIKAGMPWEFEYTKKDIEYWKDVIEKAWDLRGALSTYMWSETAEKILSWKVENITKKEKEVLILFLKNIILPQLQYAHDDSFTVLKWDLFNFFDWISWQQADSQEVINNLKKAIEEWNLNKAQKLFNQALQLLKEENEESSKGIVKSLDNQKYNFDQIKRNHEVFKKMGELLNLGEGRINILYKFDNLDDFIEAYWLQNFKEVISKVYENVENNKVVYEEISRKDIKIIRELFSVVWTDKLGEFKLKYLEKKDNVKYVNRGLHKYGMDLRNAHNSKEKYELLSNYGVEKGYNTIDTLFKGLVQIQWLDSIWYEEFNESLKNLEEISIEQLDNLVLNTSRQNIDSSYLTEFKRGLDKNDTYVNHTTIDKQFVYYENGKKVIEKIKYHIYLRPECSNLLIVPETIEVYKTKVAAPRLKDIAMYNQIPLTIPLVIPYNILKWWLKWGKSWNSSTPWEIQGWSNWGGGGIPDPIEWWWGRL